MLVRIPPLDAPVPWAVLEGWCACVMSHCSSPLFGSCRHFRSGLSRLPLGCKMDWKILTLDDDEDNSDNLSSSDDSSKAFCTDVLEDLAVDLHELKDRFGSAAVAKLFATSGFLHGLVRHPGEIAAVIDEIKKALGGKLSHADLIKLLTTGGFLGFFLRNQESFAALVSSLAESSRSKLSPSQIVSIFSTGGSARAIQKESFWPSIDMLLSNNYLLPKDVAQLLTKDGSANAIQKDAFFPAIVRLVEEFSFTTADVHNIVKTKAAPYRIQRSDFFERVSFLHSLGFSGQVMPRMFDDNFGQAFLFLTDPMQIESRTKLLRWLIFEEDGGLGLGVDTVYDMFFVQGGRLTDRAKSIDSPLFCDFVKMIKKRFPRKKVGYAFRKHWQEMDEYIENALAEEAAAAADEAFAKCSVDWPLDSRAMRVPDIYANYFALEGEFKRLRICIPSDQTREVDKTIDSFIVDQISVDDPMSHQLQKLHEVQDEKVSLSSDLGGGFATVSRQMKK